MRRSLSWSCSLAAVLAMAGCANSNDDDAADTSASAPTAAASSAPSASPSPAAARVPVVASANFYGDLVQRIGGDRVDVTSIITSANQDPHSFEANTRTQLALSAAKVVIKNGGHYDDFMNTLLSSVSGQRTVIDAVEISGKGEGEEAEHADASASPSASASPATSVEAHVGEEPGAHAGEEPGHGQGGVNEHVWYDLASMDTLAGRIAEELSTVQPESRDFFQTNASAFRSGLGQLRARQEALKAKYAGQKVAVTEPVPLYMIEASGLENVTPDEFSEGIEEGSDIPIRVLQDTIDLMSKDKIEALIYNDQTTGPQTEQVRAAAEKNGVPVVSVTETLPEGSDFLAWMGTNLDSLERALAS